jgi:hypothetical protein
MRRHDAQPPQKRETPHDPHPDRLVHRRPAGRGLRFHAAQAVSTARKKRPRVLLQLPPPAPRNRIAVALAARRSSGAAGRHDRSQGAQRRADRVALQKTLRREQST